MERADREDEARGAEASEGVAHMNTDTITLIDEDGLGLIEAHAVFLGVGCGLVFIPLETKCAHVESVITS